MCKTTEIKLELTTEQPVCVRPYRVPFAKQHIITNMVDEMLDNGIITPSNSPYASSVLMVKKSQR